MAVAVAAFVLGSVVLRATVRIWGLAEIWKAWWQERRTLNHLRRQLRGGRPTA